MASMSRTSEAGSCCSSSCSRSWRTRSHPARQRYARLSRVASAMCARRGVVNDLEPQPPLTFPERSRDDDFISYVRFAEAVACLGRQDLNAQQRKDAAWSIRHDLRRPMHVAERESDPCPWCAGISPLETFTAHLWSCERHPGFRWRRRPLPETAPRRRPRSTSHPANGHRVCDRSVGSPRSPGAPSRARGAGH